MVSGKVNKRVQVAKSSSTESLNPANSFEGCGLHHTPKNWPDSCSLSYTCSGDVLAPLECQYYQSLRSYLNIALCTQGPRLEQWFTVVDTTSVHVQS